MYETILAPIDGSEAAAASLEHALSLGETFDGTVHVLFVADTAQDSVTVVGTDVIDALVGEGTTVVEEAEERAQRRGIDVQTAVEQGDPASVILDHAEKVDADVIVMGTHGRRGLTRFLLGSVTERVLRSASAPVIAVTPSDDE